MFSNSDACPLSDDMVAISISTKGSRPLCLWASEHRPRASRRVLLEWLMCCYSSDAKRILSHVDLVPGEPPPAFLHEDPDRSFACGAVKLNMRYGKVVDTTYLLQAMASVVAYAGMACLDLASDVYLAIDLRNNALYSSAEPRVVSAYRWLTAASLGAWLLLPLMLAACNADVARGETRVRRAATLLFLWMANAFNVPAWLMFLPELTVKVATVRCKDAPDAALHSVLVLGFSSRAAWKSSARVAAIVPAMLLIIEDIPLIALNLIIMAECGLFTPTAIISAVVSGLAITCKIAILLEWCSASLRFLLHE